MQKQIQLLNEFLASFSIATANAKSYHWLINGQNFFVLHAKFEELYDILAENADIIAERVLALRGLPVVGYSNWLKISKISEAKDFTEKEIIEEILQTFEILTKQANEVKVICLLQNDTETDNKIQEIVYEIQKLAWMYKSFLK
jgi:starvation-inducible DNA-binding protein